MGSVDQSAGKTYKGICDAYPHYTFGYVEPASGSALARRAILVKQGEGDTGKVVLEGAEYDATVEQIGKLQRVAQSAACAPASTSANAAAPVTTVSTDSPEAAKSGKGMDFTPWLVAAGVGALAFHLAKRQAG
jgi:hypothetical protein